MLLQRLRPSNITELDLKVHPLEAEEYTAVDDLSPGFLKGIYKAFQRASIKAL